MRAADREAEIAPRRGMRRPTRRLCATRLPVAASLEKPDRGRAAGAGPGQGTAAARATCRHERPSSIAFLEAAYQSAKRVRHETGIAGQSVSMAACAVSVLRRMHGDVSNLGGLLIGDGDMAELIFEQVSATGMKRWTMAHPQERRARAWAERNHAHWRPLANAAGAGGIRPGGERARSRCRGSFRPKWSKAALKAQAAANPLDRQRSPGRYGCAHRRSRRRVPVYAGRSGAPGDGRPPAASRQRGGRRLAVSSTNRWHLSAGS